jgi:UDPglucose--hexose-1-phosphate uridylyltransferase
VDGRIVAENESFVAFTPYASRLPYETWIAPRRHSPDFEKIGDGELRDMAYMVRSVLRGVASLLEDPPYNLYVVSAPCDGGNYAYYHWRVVLVPRITRIGGFELASGIFINIASPEEAADRLREALHRS